MKIVVMAALLFAAALTPAMAEDKPPMLLQSTDVVANTIKLPLLRDHPLAVGNKEIRIWWGFGIFEPEKMVRIMLDLSGHISGETYLYYTPLQKLKDRGEKDAGTLKFYKELHKQCAVLARGQDKEVCVPVNDSDTLWATVYAELLKEDIWTLPDESVLPRSKFEMVDGVAMVVELRDGGKYRAYSYSNPMIYDAHEAREAEAIMGTLDETGNVQIRF